MSLRPFTYEPPKEKLKVIFCDNDILVIDKPSGLLSVAGNKPFLQDCLESRAKEEFSSALIVHRLDKDTSGVIILALNKKAHVSLGKQFENRQIKKNYIARVFGVMENDEGQVNEPIFTDWVNRPKQKIDYENGRNAITNWQVINKEKNATKVQLNPITGRTHQLRIHMLHLGFPILGDNLYAHDEALMATSRLQLHALNLTFLHPVSKCECFFEADCPF